MMSSTDEEQIIRRRLQIDGEGVGDDRRINLLLRTFMRWCNEDTLNTQNQNQLSQQIALNEFGIIKSEISEQMIHMELKEYKKVSDNIADKIERIKHEIEDSKNDLIIAKEVRRNKLEYTSLARLIKDQPNRKKIIEKYKQLQSELIQQNDEFQKINKNLENRRKDFACFMMLANELFKDVETLNYIQIEEDDRSLIDEQIVDVESMIIE